MTYLQHRGGAAAVPHGPIFLEPPLKLLWSFEGIGAEPLTDGLHTWVWAGDDHAILSLDAAGHKRWRYSCRFAHFALLGDEVIGVVALTSSQEERLVVLDAATGRERRGFPCEHAIDKLLPGQRAFVGSTTVELAPERFRYVLAAVEFSAGPDILWTHSTEYDYQSDSPKVAYDSQVACDDEHVFVVRGPELVALDLKTGQEEWATQLAELGGAPLFRGKTMPMVSQGLVVINTAGGTAAFRVTDGQLSWFFPMAGARTVYGDRVYLATMEEYYVLDLMTGACVRQAPVAALAERRWRLKRVQLSSHLAVSETHAFVGDTRGRLYALERDTGEPVWKDQPEGITGFSGNIPVIARNRLYISSFSMAPAPPPRLYCYAGGE